MAVGFGHSAASHTSGSSSASQASFTWNVDTSSDRSVVVFVCSIASTNTATSVTVGGTTAPAVSGGTAADTATEPGFVASYFLDNVSQGASTAVVVNRTNNATQMWAVAISFTAAGATEVNTAGIVALNDNQAYAEQSVDDGSLGTNSLRVAMGYYGGATPAPQGTNSTQLHTNDLTAFGVSCCRETTAGQGARSVGFTQATSDDVAAVHFAVREVSTYTGPVYQTSAQLTGATQANSDVPIPTGVVANDVAVVTFYLEPGVAVTPPDGTWTEKNNISSPGSTAPPGNQMRVFWHRASGSESGTWAFTHSSTFRRALAIRVSGCATSGDPWDGATDVQTTASGTTTPGVQVTTSVVDTLLVWAANQINGGDSWTPPTGFTERLDTSSSTIATKQQAAAGATGSLTGTCAGGDELTAFLGALMAPQVVALPIVVMPPPD